MPPILDVAIGLLFVYLLFSLIVTAARELCVAFTASTWDKRALLLKEGIGELFCDQNQSGGFSQKFFQHPLITALCPKGDGSIPNYIPRETFVSAVLDLIADPKATGPRTSEELLVGIFGSVKPIFIARVTESLRTLRDQYAADNTVTKAITACLGMVDIVVKDAAKRTSFKTEFDKVKTKVQGDRDTARNDRDNKGRALDQAPDDPQKKHDLATAQATLSECEVRLAALQSIELLWPKLDETVSAAASVVDGNLRRTLSALLEDAGHDLDEFKKQLAAWFDRSMDRVTGWYKKYTQGFTLALGLFLAIVCNVDSLRIIDTLSTDPKLREEIVKSATEYVNRTSVGSGKNLADARARLAAANQLLEDEKDGARKAKDQELVDGLKKEVEAAEKAWGAQVKKEMDAVGEARALAERAREDAQKAKEAVEAAAKDPAKDDKAKTEARKAAADKETSAQKLNDALLAKTSDLTSLQSWAGSDGVDRLANTVRQMNGFGLPIGWHQGDRAKAFADFPSALRTICGWILTALAASLGAPFWFDTLNKIVTIRAGGRAPEEKDPGENGGNGQKSNGSKKS